MTISKKEIIIFGLILVAFFVFRVPALHSPYHQDEYKWVLYSHPEIIPPGTVPHPPLTEFIYTKIGPVFGDDNFRTIPLIFGTINLFLIFYLAKLIFDKKTAYWSVTLFATSFYSVLSNLTVDVDGSVMPFFFLILAISYFKLKGSEWEDKRWWFLVFVGAIGGFLIKVSFILAILAIALDFAVEKKAFSDKKKVLRYLGVAIAGAVFLVLVLIGAKFIFPFFNLEYAMKYWEHFWTSSSFLGRGWFQTFIQFAKSILYTSPLLILPVFFVDKDIFRKTKPFFFFIFVGLAFYLFVFDFSIGALDRYFHFLVIPLCIISGSVFSKYFNRNKTAIWAAAVSVIVFSLQFIHHFTPPLYPKTEWIQRLFSLKWNFLYPFSGGSGPVPFYISFLFMALIWIICLGLILVCIKKKNLRALGLTFILVLGVLYNVVFIEEYLFGQINGSSRVLVEHAETFIKENPTIQKVTVYNDNGGFNIQQTGKYRKRLYIDPKFGTKEKAETLNQYKEHYMVVDIPHVDLNTIYAQYWNSCEVVFQETSGYISSKIYDCVKAPDLKI